MVERFNDVKKELKDKKDYENKQQKKRRGKEKDDKRNSG